MLPTIIFFLALLSSIAAINYNIDSYIDKNNKELKFGSIVYSVLTCIFWSYLFYLLH